MEEPVELAMRYGKPSITSGLEKLVGHCGPSLREIFIVTLYPHYAMATIRGTVEAVRDAARKMRLDVDLKFAEPFYDDAGYIDALAESARGYLEKDYDHLLISYHGLPERHLKKTDPTGAHCLKTKDCCNVSSSAHDTCYRHQVLRATELFVRRLNIPHDKYSVSFQSRLGRDEWLKPSTVDEISRLAATGVRSLKVICPAFVSDCLETLEEIGIGIQKQFLAAGGESFEMIPCMNEHPRWIEALHKICADGTSAASS
jgi:ferrochelatase